MRSHSHCGLVCTARSPSLHSTYTARSYTLRSLHQCALTYTTYTGRSDTLRARDHCGLVYTALTVIARPHAWNEREGLIKRPVFHLYRWFGAARGYPRVLDGSASALMTLLTCRDNLSGPRLTAKCKSVQLDSLTAARGETRFKLGVWRTWGLNK